MIHYNKLIRDNVPEMIQVRNKKVSFHEATDKELWFLLVMKLQEEINEFSKNQTLEQLADVFDILDEIMGFKGFDKKELEAIRENKNTQFGGFSKRWVLEESEVEVGERQEQGI